MAVDVARAGPRGTEARARVSAVFWRRPWIKGIALLSVPVLAFLIVYIGSLAVLFVSSFWTVDSFTGKLQHVWNLGNFRQILSTSDPTYLRIAGRTIGIAAAVTLTDAILAFPLAYYSKIKFWKTPVAFCGWQAGNDCMDYSAWQRAWTEVTG